MGAVLLWTYPLVLDLLLLEQTPASLGKKNFRNYLVKSTGKESVGDSKKNVGP